MGYSVRAEYTLDIIREPKSYEHVAQQFLCTGFILASSFHEKALEAIIQRWQEIDSVTSNRVRFLFFIENETVLTSYPNTPHFTESGYQRYHAQLLGITRKRGFELSVKRGAQVSLYSRGETNWHPNEKVRRLAQQLGVAGSLPCLVWVRNDAPQSMYVTRLKDLTPDDIFELIRKFCDQFYDDNVERLSQIDGIESAIERMCGSLDLTAKDLEIFAILAKQHKHLTALLQSIQHVPTKHEGALGPTYISDIAERVLDLQSLPLQPEFLNLMKRAKRWSERCDALERCLAGENRIPVNHIAASFIDCLDIVNELPATAAQLTLPQSPSPDDLLIGFSKIVTDNLLEIIENLDHTNLSQKLKKSREYIRHQIETDNVKVYSMDSEENYTTIVNAWILLQDAVDILGECQNDIINLNVQFSDFLRLKFYSITQITSITLHLWIYYQLCDCIKILDQKLKRINRLAEWTYDQSEQWYSKVADSLALIKSISQSLDWKSLLSYERRCVPQSVVAQITSPHHSLPQPAEAIEALCDKIASGLMPIATVMAQLEIATVAPFEEHLEHVHQIASRMNLVVSPGATVGFADTIIHMEDKSMSKIEVTMGDGTVFHGDFAVAETIKSSFNKASNAEVDADLKKLLKDLTVATAKMSECLPGETAKDVAQDLDAFVTEVAKGKPRRKWYELSSEGLIEAAKTVGSIGVPVTETVKTILKALG